MSPPQPPRLLLHSYWRSSSSWRVRIGLHLKRVAFDTQPVNLLAGEQFGADHLRRNPTGQVPVLEVEEGGTTHVLFQSMAILEWLDERFPAPPLLPPDDHGRARVRALAELVNSGIQPYQNLKVLKWLKAHQAGMESEWARHWVGAGLAALEAAARDGCGRFCHGDEVTLADLYLVPQLFAARRLGVEVAPFPTLLRVEAACQELEPFRQAEPQAQPDAAAPDGRS